MIPAKVEGTFRLLHTADWHLGKLLNEHSRDEEHARFLIWLLGIVEKHAVDAVILAGDVFDSANPPQSALERYFNFVSSLHRQGGDCSLVVIAGNHDSAAQLEAPKRVAPCELMRFMECFVDHNLCPINFSLPDVQSLSDSAFKTLNDAGFNIAPPRPLATETTP